jgi:hypothetical protein
LRFENAAVVQRVFLVIIIVSCNAETAKTELERGVFLKVTPTPPMSALQDDGVELPQVRVGVRDQVARSAVRFQSRGAEKGFNPTTTCA